MEPAQMDGEDSPIALSMLLQAQRDATRHAFGRLCVDPLVSPLVGVAQWVSWGQIAQWVFDTCRAIDAEDLQPGAHLASVEPNSVQWIVLDFACQILGVVHVAIDYRWPGVMVQRLIEQSDATLIYSRTFTPIDTCRASLLSWEPNWLTPVIDQSDLRHLIERVRRVQLTAPAQMLFTSGTSGEPRGVLLSHRNLVSNAFAKLAAAPQFETDLRLNLLPFCHAYARTCELSTWVLSNSQLAIAHSWEDLLWQASRLKPTLVNLVPHLANKLVHRTSTCAPHAASHHFAPHEVVERLGGRVRLLQVGGAALPDPLWHQLAKCGLPPLQGYGLTEASPVVCSNRAGQQQPGTIGWPVNGVEVRVDALGQLWVRGDNVMCGYYGDLPATQARIRDGWLATGDLVDVDARGHFRILGRLSEVIVLSTGFKVSPELIEARLLSVDWIEQVLIVGQGQSYVAAILWPVWSALPSDCFTSKIHDSQSVNWERLQEIFASVVEQQLGDLPSFMRPRKLLTATQSSSADVAAELLNSKGALRRGQVLARFLPQIDAMFSEQSLQYSTQPNEYQSNE